MKPGEIVVFKWATLPPPYNIGIFLSRIKHGKRYFAELLTSKGKIELKVEHVSKNPYGLPALEIKGKEQKDLEQELKNLLVRAKKAKESPTVSLKELREKISERDLWLRVNSPPIPRKPEGLAQQYFQTSQPTNDQLRIIRELLDQCAQPGIGYFKLHTEDSQSLYSPISDNDYRKVKARIDQYYQFRRIIFASFGEDEVVDTEGEPVEPEDAPFLGFQRDTITLDLPEDLTDALDEICRLTAKYIRHDRWKVDEDEGIARTGIIAIDGFDLRAFIYEVSVRTVGEPRLSNSSLFLLFLFHVGYFDFPHALNALAARRINSGDFAFQLHFPEPVLRAAGRLDGHISEMERNDREDYTKLWTVTIDPPDAKDFDDAISFVSTGATYELYVHIADVSHYVHKDSFLDTSAQKRATSVYLPSFVLPMLPPRLSEDLCSLRAGEERRAVTVRLSYSREELQVLETTISKSIIFVNRNLSYPYVDEKIGTHERPYWQMHEFASRLREISPHLLLQTSEIKIFVEPDEITLSKKYPTAATEMIETFMITANEAVARFITEHKVPMVYRTHGLPDRSQIETFEGKCRSIGLPLTIGIDFERFGIKTEPKDAQYQQLQPHDGADPMGMPKESALEDTLAELMKFSSFGGITIKVQDKTGKRRIVGGAVEAADRDPGPHGERTDIDHEQDNEPVHGLSDNDSSLPLQPIDPEQRDYYLEKFNALLQQIEELPWKRSREYISNHVLTLLQRANYSTTNIGHFGLGSECYTHFTSPIRRYPDLIIHRILTDVLDTSKTTVGTSPLLASETDGTVEGDTLVYSPEELDSIAEHCSDQSRAAEQFEYDLKAVCGAFYCLAHPEFLASLHQGVITGITSAGVFVSFHDYFEGRLPLRALSEGRIVTDEFESVLFYPEPSGVEIDGSLIPEELDHAMIDSTTIPSSRIICKLFDPITVKIKSIDFIEGRFELVWIR